jgi:hypothetical protein
MHRGDQVTYFKALLKKHMTQVMNYWDRFRDYIKNSLTNFARIHAEPNQVAEEALNQCLMDNYANYRFLIISEQEKFEAEVDFFYSHCMHTFKSQVYINEAVE